MKIYKFVGAIGAALAMVSTTGHAALTPITGANGVQMVYSSITDLTWMADATLLRSMMQTFGQQTVIDNIMAASPVVTSMPSVFDTPQYSGHHTVVLTDFKTDGTGRANWFGNQAFANYLNSIAYGGVDTWHLPSAGTTPKSGVFKDGDDNEFGLLSFKELGQVSGAALADSPLFENEQSGTFASGNELSAFVGNASSAWYYTTSSGRLQSGTKTSFTNAWLVSDGQYSPITPTSVPVPGGAWLLGGGLVAWLGLRRRRAD